MRSRRLVMLVGAGLLVIGCVVVALQWSPPVPFAFLEGHQGVLANGRSRFLALDHTVYGFDEPAAFIQVAHAELTKKGYVLQEPPGASRLYARAPSEMVFIHKDIMFVPRGQEFRQGWVTVLVYSERRPSVWQRLLSLFGL